MIFFPITFVIKVIVAAFVAGPAAKNTNAAPGEIPFNINVNAIGIDAVAQIYNGIPAINIINIPVIPAPISKKNLSGIT